MATLLLERLFVNPLDRDRLLLQIGIFILGFAFVAMAVIIVAALYP